MTIQFPSNHNTATPAADGGAGQVRHTGTATVSSQDPASWRDVPPPESDRDSRLHSHMHGRVPLSPPPDGDTSPATRAELVGKFDSFVHGQHKQDGATGNGGNTGGATAASGKGGNAGSATGAGNNASVTPPTRHISIDDVLQLLLKENADGFKMEAAQTQQAVTNKVESLDNEANDIRNAGHDRMVGAVLSGVGMMAQGLASMGAASVSGYGIMNANLALESGPSIDPTTEAQMFTKLTASSSTTGQALGGLGNAIQGGFNVGQGSKESDASRLDSDKAEEDKEVTEQDALHDNAQAMKQQLLSVMQDYVDKRKSMEQQQDETMRAIARA